MFLVGLCLTLIVISQAAPLDKAVEELGQLKQRTVSKNLTLVLEEATMVRNWPSEDEIDYLGQVSGLSFCPRGFLYIFHRADREMDARLFDDDNRYTRVNEGPIKDNTILKMNNKVTEPKIITGFGDNMFFLPHGIFADKDHVWTTDLALHQVFRFSHGSKTPDLVLGERFVPGNDHSHFCKPAHAVEASDGSVFIADGYCNSRIMKFDKSGKFILQFGNQKGPGQLSLPHHLALIESKNLICVADRENNRIQCYNAGMKEDKEVGKLVKVISDTRFGPIYAVGFNVRSSILYIVSGMTNDMERSRVFLYNWDNDIITGSIDHPGPNGFGMAHTITVCPRQRCLAIGSLTKECIADAEVCMERAEDDVNYLPRNIWLYGLTDENVELE